MHGPLWRFQFTSLLPSNVDIWAVGRLRGPEGHTVLQALLTSLPPVPVGSGQGFVLCFFFKISFLALFSIWVDILQNLLVILPEILFLIGKMMPSIAFSLSSLSPSASLPLSFRSPCSSPVQPSSSFFSWVSTALRVHIPQTRLLSLLLFLFSLLVSAVQTASSVFLFLKGQKDIHVFLVFPIAPSSVLNVQERLNTFFLVIGWLIENSECQGNMLKQKQASNSASLGKMRDVSEELRLEDFERSQRDQVWKVKSERKQEFGWSYHCWIKADLSGRDSGL